MSGPISIQTVYKDYQQTTLTEHGGVEPSNLKSDEFSMIRYTFFLMMQL